MKRNAVTRAFDRISTRATEWTGSTQAFITALLLVIVWLASGPLFHYSDTWQLVINTLTSVATFLVVFLIQRSQNKDTLAIQLKLSELIAATKGAANAMSAIEDLSEDELRRLRDRYVELAQRFERPARSAMDAASAADRADVHVR